MDPVTLGAVLLAVVSGAGSQWARSCGRVWFPWYAVPSIARQPQAVCGRPQVGACG